jgi:proton glutamate symport protein
LSSQPETESIRRPARTVGLSTKILIGLVGGIACGIFLGEYTYPLKIVGDAFVALLQMTVLPFIVVSLIANFGRLRLLQTRRLAVEGGLIMAFLWLNGFTAVVLFAHCFPAWNASSFFSTVMVDPPPKLDFVGILIPKNVFESLAQSVVPAVVTFCIAIGIALAGVAKRKKLIGQLDVWAKALMRLNHFMVRLTPAGVFAVSASTAGTITFDEFNRLQAYLVTYTAATLLLTFVVLPMLVVTFTPFSYREVMGVSKDALITAFATGKLIIVLPLLVEATEELFARYRESSHDPDVVPAVDVLYPLAYPFPHLGKLVSILFIPFAAWFLGQPLAWDEYPRLLSAGLASHFGGPILATPFLLELMRLPHDMFQLFLLTGVYCGRLSDALGVIHLVAFTILTTCLFTGQLRIEGRRIVRFVVLVTAAALTVVGLTRFGLQSSLAHLQRREDVLAQMQLLDKLVESRVLEEAAPNPDPLLPGESLLERIRRREALRVGFNADKLPFAYFNEQGALVGYDIEMAHGLARDLRVKLELAPFDRATLAEQLEQDHFDVVMSGLVGTMERAETLLHTGPYMDVTLALVVPDHRMRNFKTFRSIRQIPGLRIGFVDLSRAFVARFREDLPRDAQLIELPSNRQFFEQGHRDLDALLISAESGSAFTLLYPEFEVVVPEGRAVSLPLVYAVGAGDKAMRDLLDHWIHLRKTDGTTQRIYNHWVLGQSQSPQQPRWSVLRNVLGWVD